MQTMNTSDLRTVLESLPNEPADVTITSRTEPAMRKTNNPYIGRVFKLSIVSGTINWHYASEVNRQRNREGGFTLVDGAVVASEVDNFEARPRKWGTRLKDSPFVEHKGNFYLEMKVRESQGHEYRDEYGDKIPDEKMEKIRSFFPKKSESSRQGVNGEIILRDYRFDRITAITLHDSGNMQFVVDNVPVTSEVA